MDELIKRARRNDENGEEESSEPAEKNVVEEDERDSIDILLDDSESSDEDVSESEEKEEIDIRENDMDSDEDMPVKEQKDSPEKGSDSEPGENISGGGKNLRKALDREKNETASQRFKKLKEEAKERFIEEEKMKKRQEDEAKVTGDALSDDSDEDESLKDKYDRYSDGNILH